jgi:predicted Zn-dependent protease
MLDNLKEGLRTLIAEYPNLKIQIYLTHWQTDFCRFYRSQTNYNISKNVISASVSLYKEQRNYSFSLNNPTVSCVRDKINEAIAIIDSLPPDPDFVDIETDTRLAKQKLVKNNITALPLSEKVEILKRFSNAVKPFDFEIYGTFICNYQIEYLINSNGLDKKTEGSPVYIEVKAVSNKNEVTVLECTGSEDADQIDINAMVDSLVAKVKTAQNEVIDVDAGEYEVILAPRCIGELLGYYSWTSLAAASIDQQDTDLAGREGEQIFPEFFTLHDLPHHPAVIGMSYSSDGHLSEDLPIFERGVFKNFFVDCYYAHKLKMHENGNSGDCLVMQTGDISLPDMIKSVKKGLYISSFHYMNFINSRETSLTGLTRDGTFLIEDGKLTSVVNNLRFTEKIADVINNITAIENRAYTVPSSGNYSTFSISACSMPHVRVKKFSITSSTQTV